MSGLSIAGSGLTLVNPSSGGGINITQLARGDFASTVSQNISNVLNPQAITLNTPINTQGISLVASTKLTAATSGYYLFVWTAQAHITTGSNKNLWIWLRYNGADVAYSTQFTTFNAGPPVYITGSNVVQLNANDYIEFWMAGDSTNCQVQALPASAGPPAYPAAPSFQVTITQVG